MINDREEFESWFTENKAGLLHFSESDYLENYISARTRIAFIAWQAAQQDIKKQVSWRVEDIRAMLLQGYGLDEWSTPIINLDTLLRCLGEIHD